MSPIRNYFAKPPSGSVTGFVLDSKKGTLIHGNNEVAVIKNKVLGYLAWFFRQAIAVDIGNNTFAYIKWSSAKTFVQKQLPRQIQDVNRNELAKIGSAAEYSKISYALLNIFKNAQSNSYNQGIDNRPKNESALDKIKELSNTREYLHFYLHGLFEFLGNFSAVKISYNGHSYENVEAAFQAQKFPGKEGQFAHCNGEEAFQISRKLSHTHQLPNNWHHIKTDIMRDLLKEKFKNPQLREMLLATGNTCLIEHNERKGRDAYWSDDFDGSGKNMLGQLLMEERGRLGGTGVVRRPESYTNDLKNFDNKLPVLT